MSDSLSKMLQALSGPKPRAEYRSEVRRKFVHGAAAQPASRFLGWSAAVAAAVALAWFLWSLPPAASETWLLAEVGTAVEGRLHHPGPGDLQIELGDRMCWKLLPGTTVDLESPRPGEPLRVAVQEGVALATTGPDFPAEGLMVSSRYLEINVSGTTFGVLAGPDSTCVCILEGTVLFDNGLIPPGTVLTRFSNRPPARRALPDPERTMLRELAERYR